jgi:putative peptidoglycan lipid II flippase
VASTVELARPASAAACKGGIARAAVSVSLAAIVVKLAGILKESAVAGVYGRSDAMDAFLIAALIPALVVNLIAESMNQALIPTLVRVREQQGRRQAQELLSSAMLWSCALLLGVSLAVGAAARGFFPLLASHFAEYKLVLSIHLFYGLLPTVLMAGIAGNCAAVLNTEQDFAIPALMPIVSSVFIFAGVVVFGSRFGIWTMVWATLAGAAMHALLVAGRMKTHGYFFRLRWYGKTEAIRDVSRQYGPVLLSGAVASGGLIVDQAMAAMLPAGSVSALAYAGRFVSVALTLVAGTLSTTLTPYFSQRVALRDWRACQTAVRSWSRVAALASIPIATLLIAGAPALVHVAFQRGAFGHSDTVAVARTLSLYALQVPFFAVSRVSYRLLIAMRRSDLVLACGGINLLLDVVLNLVLMRWLGVAGIALATSLWTFATYLFLGYWARRLLRESELESPC